MSFFRKSAKISLDDYDETAKLSSKSKPTQRQNTINSRVNIVPYVRNQEDQQRINEKTDEIAKLTAEINVMDAEARRKNPNTDMINKWNEKNDRIAAAKTELSGLLGGKSIRKTRNRGVMKKHKKNQRNYNNNKSKKNKSK